jgi:lipid-binding SYLF domain-containing protein
VFERGNWLRSRSASLKNDNVHKESIMKRYLTAFAIAAFFLFSTGLSLKAEYRQNVKVDKAMLILQDIMSDPATQIPPALLKDSYAVAVIPGVVKAGLVVGGSYGEGILVDKVSSGDWSDPLFITLAGGSVGFQAGLKSTDVVLVFRDRQSMEGILKGKFKLGVDASVAAGPVGGSAVPSETESGARIYSYTRSKGLFAGVALDGAVLGIAPKATESFYGSDVSPQEVLQSQNLKAPATAREFDRLLARYTP